MAWFGWKSVKVWLSCGCKQDLLLGANMGSCAPFNCFFFSLSLSLSHSLSLTVFIDTAEIQVVFFLVYFAATFLFSGNMYRCCTVTNIWSADFDSVGNNHHVTVLSFVFPKLSASIYYPTRVRLKLTQNY